MLKSINPPLRFKDKNGEDYPSWETKKLGDVFYQVNNIKNNHNYDLLTSSKSGIVLQKDYFNKEVASKDKSSYKLIKKNDFTYRSMSDDKKFYINILENYEDGLVSPAYTVFRSYSDYHIKFLKYIFHLSMFFNKLEAIVTGSTRYALRFNQFESIQIPMPCMDEQIKIGNFLKSIDDKITIQVKKLEELRNYKKGLMQQLFPKANQTNPTLRFRDEEGKDYPSWETKKLGDVGEFLKGVSYKPEDIFGEDNVNSVRLLRSNNINYNLINIDDIKIIDKKCVAQNQYLQDNDICICMANGSIELVGKNALYKNQSDGYLYTIGSFCGAYRSNINSFLIYIFQNILFKKYIKEISAGSSINNLKAEHITSFSFPMPCMDEQIKIGNFLKSIDDKITIQVKKLEELRNYKKGLMQQLFVKI